MIEETLQKQKWFENNNVQRHEACALSKTKVV